MNMVKVATVVIMLVKHMVLVAEKVVCLIIQQIMAVQHNMVLEKVLEMVLQLEYQEVEVFNLVKLVEQRLMVVHLQLVSLN